MLRSGRETGRAGVLGGGSDHESAAVSLDVGPLEALNPNCDPHGLSQLWKRAFNLYVTGKGLVNDSQNGPFC